MRFFVIYFVFLSSCFATEDLLGGDENSPGLKRVPSISCHMDLTNRVKEAIIGSKKPITIVLDFDEVLRKGIIKRGTEVTIPTELAIQLDFLIECPDVKKNIYGIFILTARLTRPMDEKDLKKLYSEEEMTSHRKEVISTTNTQLEECVPNIARFLRSRENFCGTLPDFLHAYGNEEYRKDGCTIHTEGFLYNCGLLVMGGAINSAHKLRHCKHFTLQEALRMVPKPDGGFGILYIDDHKPWFSPFVEKGFGDGVIMHLFHYDVATQETIKPKPVMQDRLLKDIDYEDDQVPSVKSIIYSAARYFAIAEIVYCVLKPLDSLRHYRAVRYFERALIWAVRLTLNCMKRLVFKILFDQ